MFIQVHCIPQPACGNYKQLCVIFIQTAGYKAIITINDYSFVKRSVQDYRHAYIFTLGNFYFLLTTTATACACLRISRSNQHDLFAVSILIDQLQLVMWLKESSYYY